MILTEEQKNEFNDKGFIIIKSFYNEKEMKAVSTWLDELRDKTPVEGEEAKYYEKSCLNDENTLVRIEHILGKHNPEMTKLLIGQKTNEYLNDLFDEPAVLFKEKVNFKFPGCRADKLHQDQAAGWNDYGSFYITMGIIVDENRKDNAAVSFMKSGNYKKELMGEEWKPLSEDDPPYQPEDEYMLLEADSGDVIFFDSYVPHGSPANTGDRGRRNLYLTFNKQSAGDKRDKYYADKWAIYPPNQSGQARSAKSFRV